MRIHILAFGIAKDILQTNKLEHDLNGSLTIRALKDDLVQHYADFEKLRSLRFAVNEEYVDDTYILNEGDEVVLIPPVSGG